MRTALVAIIVSGSVTVPCLAVVDAGTAVPFSSVDADPASHVTAGVVKGLEARRLLLVRSGAGGRELSLAITAGTHVDGTLAVGASVSVRYRLEGTQAVATAITVQRTSGSARRTA